MPDSLYIFNQAEAFASVNILLPSNFTQFGIDIIFFCVLTTPQVSTVAISLC